MLTRLLKVNNSESVFSKFSVMYIAFLAPFCFSSANVLSLSVLLELYAVSLAEKNAEQQIKKIMPIINKTSVLANDVPVKIFVKILQLGTTIFSPKLYPL